MAAVVWLIERSPILNPPDPFAEAAAVAEGIAYRSLTGMGKRFKRANPLHRVAEIWPDIKQDTRDAFESLFPEIQSDVEDWRKRRSTRTGS